MRTLFVKLRVLWLGYILLLGLSQPMVVRALNVSLTMPRTNYFVGERIVFYISTTNNGVLYFPTSIQASYLLDNGQFAAPNMAWQVITTAQIPRTWTNTHSTDEWKNYPLNSGPHRVCGAIDAMYGSDANPHGMSATNTFWIQAPPPAKGNFSINFSELIGTNIPIVSLAAYDACGIHFTNLPGGYLMHGSDLNSKGINVFFDMPVFGATVRIAGMMGNTVTMTAKNSAGQILATASGLPFAATARYDQTLSVQAMEPISKIEWSTSLTNSSLSIDDLLVITGPVLAASVHDEQLRLAWPTVSNRVYQVWSSPDLRNWSRAGALQSSISGTLTNDFPTTNSVQQFFRVSLEY